MARWVMLLPPVLFAGLAGLFYFGMQRENPGELRSVWVGHEAPALPTTLIDGIPALTDADLRTGKVTVVNFWATWCPPCVEELPLLDRFFQENATKGWQVVGLAIDQPSAVRAFLQKLPVRFPVGLAGLDGTDLGKSLGNLSGALPFSVVFGRAGTIVQRRLGKVTSADLAQWLQWSRD